MKDTHDEDARVGTSADGPLSLLREGCGQMGIPFSRHQAAQFDAYFRLLVEWNERLNLTAITGYEDVQTKHFLDSVAALPLIREELGAETSGRPLRLIDVGTGAGFPGIPLKIVEPALRLTLMDGTQKKIAFLEAVTAALDLTEVEVVHGRAEELGRTAAFREQFQLVTARAVAPLATLVEYLLPLTARGGLTVVYKGPGAPEEFMQARRAIKLLGGEVARLAPVTVPFLAERRFVLLIKKVAATPPQYPRGQGLARKKPLL
jgi:16S rRNA (guanine527-N7)-methyltransferase